MKVRVTWTGPTGHIFRKRVRLLTRGELRRIKKDLTQKERQTFDTGIWFKSNNGMFFAIERHSIISITK